MDDRCKTYLFQYRHKDADWMLEIKASSLEDAKQRLAKLPWATPLGELVAKVPGPMGFLVKLCCAVRNLFGGLR